MTARTTALFPRRVTAGRVAGEAELRTWRETPAGRAFYDAMVVHVVERAGVRAGRLISVGEGDGAFAARLASLLPDVEVLGLDVSARLVKAARQRYRAPNLRFATGDASDLAAHGQAETIVALQAFNHFEEPARALREMFEVVAPGGSLVVIDLRRDADANAYLRRLDDHLGEDRIAHARLLRASVAAAHTGPELLAMAESLGGAARLSRFRWTPDAQVAYARVDPDSLARVTEDLAGLMVELQLVRPRERGTPESRSARRANDAVGPRARGSRRGGVEPFAAPSERLQAGAGVGTILWSAAGDQLWTDPGAREQGLRCPAGWGDLLAADARRVALQTSPRQVIERTFALNAHDHIVARSGWCDGAGAVAVVTTLEEVRTSMDLSALALRCGLTAREVEVAKLAAAGLSNRGIGFRLGMATPTVGNYLTHLYQKTGTSGRLELARLVLLAQAQGADAVRRPARAAASEPRHAGTS